MLNKNRFFRTSDFNDPQMARLKNIFDEYYVNRWKGNFHPWGAKEPEKIIIHWSRELEYPWAVINGEVRKEYKILDCGCGGSPLLPYLIETTKCKGYGIDNGAVVVCDSKPSLLPNLKRFYINPSEVMDEDIIIKKQNINDIKYPNNYFDRVFCISVIEHLKQNVAEKGIREMVRVLKPGGKLLITMDHTSHENHIKSWCVGKYQLIIKLTGLKLDGDSNFTVPLDDEVHGYYHVVGFVLNKAKIK